MNNSRKFVWLGIFCFMVGLIIPQIVFAQGVTTAAMNGLVVDKNNEPLVGAHVIAVHEPTGTQYGTIVKVGGFFDLLNMRIGGPYTVKATFVGYKEEVVEGVYLNLAQKLRIDFQLFEDVIEGETVTVMGEREDEVLNSDRTGAATYLQPEQVTQMPSIKRSTRDLFRLDPRNDGNFSFGGRNWLYNNISLDGSYFNNPFGLDDPAPGGQTDAEPVPFDAIEQVQVSIAPFDVREGGFTGAGINTVTKSGSNQFKASLYSFLRNESLVGNEVKGEEVIADPDLSYNQSGFTVSGPIIENKLFFFVNGEIERREDPGTDYVADTDGVITFGESRVDAETMDAIRQRMIDVYGYDPGRYQDYIHETNNNKILFKLDWNINPNHNLTFRYNMLDAERDLPPHPFAISFGGTGRGPNESSLPFENAGYTINNELNSFALELNSRTNKMSNRFFFSYNRFRDFRDPFSEDFPTIEIGVDGVTYTTLGHEPFSIHNILDQDVLQVTNNFSYFLGPHVLTAGANLEIFKFYNSFNLFRHGLFQLPYFLDFEGDGIPNGSTFFSLDEFFAATDPADPIDFWGMVNTSDLFKGEDIDVGQFALYAQDEFFLTPEFNITAGIRLDFPLYMTDIVENPFSTGLTLLDENDNPEVVDQSEMPGASPLFSPRIGFNWDVTGDRTTQLRGGTGIFTGRLPFVWVGNNISNPGQNENLEPHMRSFDLNAMDPDFKWPQVWTTNIAVDKSLPGDILGTLEFVYSKDINAIYVRNADLQEPQRFLTDGRPYFKDLDGNHELNPDGGAGAYVIDNTDEGYNYNVTVQLRKAFASGLNTSLSYSFLEAKSVMKSTEIASVLWAENPVQGDPNQPQLSDSEFGNRHRIVFASNYKHTWSPKMATSIGLFVEFAEGNRFTYAGGNRYSFIYAGDVNGDGSAGNDLIYIPNDASEIHFAAYDDGTGHMVTEAEQWAAFNNFIEQDEYLSEHRGEIAERFGAVNPWFSNIDLRIMQDFSMNFKGRPHTFQFTLDILNFANLLSSDWGVRQVASSTATRPLELVGWEIDGEPMFKFNGATETFVEDVSEFSRWRIQTGFRYFF